MTDHKLRLSADLVVLPERHGRWVMRNVFTRTCLGLDSSGLETARLAECVSSGDLAETVGSRAHPVWEIDRFAHEDGLLADPTGYDRDVSNWPEPEHLEAGALVARLRDRWLLIDDEQAYRARFARKESLLDKQHFGNLHEQLGRHLLLSRREKPEEWWIHQKFADNLEGVRSDNLYGGVQAHFLSTYFREALTPGDSALDIGCGIGIYANMMAEVGATVLGVDPSDSYIEIARSKAHPNATFERRAVSEPGAMDGIPDASADLIFMSDALLFYFYPPSSATVPSLDGLLRDVKRVLKPRGRLVSVEPHHAFWLAPWLGQTDRPFTIVTEYLRPVYGVTPTLSEFVGAFTERGFAVTALRELSVDPEFIHRDERAGHFAREFPLWQLLELMPRSGR